MREQKNEGLVFDAQVEELESKIAPGGGETVLPLPLLKGKHR